MKGWWAQRDLNPRPSDYESPALTTELWARSCERKRIVRDELRWGKENQNAIGPPILTPRFKQ